jgi:hypothetical protein
MPSIGRNQPCPCGSGEKYKKCHGAYTVTERQLNSRERRAAIDLSLKQVNALNARREKQQGLGRPIIAPKMRDHQMVAVGKRIYFSKTWKTFHDFLRDYLFGNLGTEWIEAEQAKRAADRHRILRWYEQANDDAERLGTKVGAVYTAPMTGAARAFPIWRTIST